jgi:hypothetical protein
VQTAPKADGAVEAATWNPKAFILALLSLVQDYIDETIASTEVSSLPASA